MKKNPFYIDEIREINYCDTKIVYFSDNEYEEPTMVVPTITEHNIETCEDCRKHHELLIDEISKKLDKFPYCCKRHSNLLKFKEFQKSGFKDAPLHNANKIMYSYSHILQNLDCEDWYDEITNYIEYCIKSYGTVPPNCGLPFELDNYFNCLLHLLKHRVERFHSDKISKEELTERFEIIWAYLEKYLENHDKIEKNLEALMKIYNDWYKMFPFELDYFKELKADYNGKMPFYSGEKFNTLGQNGTNKTGQRPVFISGNGSDLSNDEVLKGRAKRKFITQNMMLNLMDVAKEKGENEKQKSYWNTYYCQNRVTSVEGRLYGNYCKNRFCTLCCSIRKAEIINKYFPVIEQWEEPYFVTLTVKACSGTMLRKMVKKVMQGFQRIKERHKKNFQRGKGIKLIGVKSLECNFNPAKKTYNPHLHLIVSNKRIAEILIDDWLKLWTPKFSQRQAQDMRKIFNAETGLIEIIKYGSKIFTEPDIKKKGENSSYQIYVSALDNILTAMKGVRVFERFGFNAEKKEPFITKEPQAVVNYQQWEFNSQLFDWQNTANDEVLTGYKPKPQLTAILSNCIDITSQ